MTRATRYTVRLPVDLMPGSGEVCNISTTGVLFSAESSVTERFDQGQEVHLAVRLADEAGPPRALRLEIDGRIARIECQGSRTLVAVASSELHFGVEPDGA